jgi:hypothetical protein
MPCEPGDYSPECYPAGGDPNPCPDGHYRDVNTGQCVKIDNDPTNPPDDFKCPDGFVLKTHPTSGVKYCADPNSPGPGGVPSGRGGGTVPPPPNPFAAKSSGIGPPQPRQLSPEDAALMAKLRGQITGLLDAPSRFTPEVMGGLFSRLKHNKEAAIGTGQDRINSDLIGRGLLRSGIGAELQAGNVRSAESDYAGGVRETYIAKAEADFQDKAQALQIASQFVNAREAALFQSERNDLDRYFGQQEIDLARLRIQQQWEALLLELQNKIDVANINLAGGILSGA